MAVRVDRERLGLWLMAAPFLVGVARARRRAGARHARDVAVRVGPAAARRFLGLDNFRELLGDVAFRASLRNSLTYVAIAVPLRVAIALGLALLLHRRMRGVGAERAAVFFPTVIPDVAYALLWLWILNPLYGPLNLLLGAARAADAVVALGAGVGAVGRDHHGPVPDRGRLPDRARGAPGGARASSTTWPRRAGRGRGRGSCA